MTLHPSDPSRTPPRAPAVAATADGTLRGPAGIGAVKRECGCPPWVLRCLHWEGHILAMAGPCEHYPPTEMRRVGIADGYERAGKSCPCPDVSGSFYCPESLCDPGIVFPNEAAANAEFERRELELLGREATS